MGHKSESGTILAVALILVVVLAVSGMAFLYMDFLERRRSMTERWNHAAFYLANAGLERGRAVLKKAIAGGVGARWTAILDPTHTSHPAGYPADASPDPLLCPDPSRGCVILPFQAAGPGAPIVFPEISFGGTFDDGSYTVRAFNNGGAGDSGMTDGDGIMTLRAMGTVNGEVKVIQANVKVSSNLGIMNCKDNPSSPGLDPCPNYEIGKELPDTSVVFSGGRDPQTLPASELPSMSLPLSDPNNYYRNSANFPGISTGTVPSGNSYFSPLNPADGKYYYKSGDVYVHGTNNPGTGASPTVIFATGTVYVSGKLNNTIVAGAEGVAVAKTATLSGTFGSDPVVNGPSVAASPKPYPTIVGGTNMPASFIPFVPASSGTGVWCTTGSTIKGNIYATGTIDLWNTEVHGSIIGSIAKIGWDVLDQTFYTDDNNPLFYEFMPGFNYPDKTMKATVVSGSWREIQ